MFRMLVLVLIALFLFACKKQPVNTTSVKALDKKQLIGNWQLDSFNHGDGVYYAFPDYTKEVEYKETTETWTINNFGSVGSSTHTYEIVSDTIYMTYTNSIQVENYFKKTGNTLIIRQPNTQYPIEWFSKK